MSAYELQDKNVYSARDMRDAIVHTATEVIGVTCNDNGRTPNLRILMDVAAIPIIQPFAHLINIPVSVHQVDEPDAAASPSPEPSKESMPRDLWPVLRSIGTQAGYMERLIYVCATVQANKIIKCINIRELFPDLTQSQWHNASSRLVKLKLMKKSGASRGTCYSLTKLGDKFLSYIQGK
jgi:hypothetical protein